jgi:hypothetical protein
MNKQQQTTVNKKLTRYEKALRIVKSNGVKQIGPNYFEVTSESNPLVNYAVFMNINRNHDSFCECEDHQRTQQPCKHILAAELYQSNLVQVAMIEERMRQALAKIGIVEGVKQVVRVTA